MKRLLMAVIVTLFLPISLGFSQELTASWYSIASLKRDGQWKITKGVMANGKKFQDEKFTCATRDYELGTYLKIIDNKTGKSIYVKVTDRMSKRFRGKRIDLSKRAFSKIADLKQGVIRVKVEKISH